MIFVPIPLPRKVLQTSYCTHLLLTDGLQTGLGMGMGMNGTAQMKSGLAVENDEQQLEGQGDDGSLAFSTVQYMGT